MNFNKDEHELLLTTRQSTKLRNAINNNSATDIKLRKAQIKKFINRKRYFESWRWDSTCRRRERQRSVASRAKGDGSKKKTKFTVTFSSTNKYRNK